MTDNSPEQVNILLVDDQPGKLLSYEAMLGELGENLIKAHSADEALQKLLKTDIGVILLDVNMPGQDGFELADMIRQHPRFQNIAILFTSSTRLTDEDRLKGYAHGAVEYISVPIIPELLRAKVKVFAELHRKTRQLETLNRELHDLSRRMMATQDDERRRIARELHDGLGQELVGAKMLLASVGDRDNLEEAKLQIAGAQEQIDSAIKQVRTISHLLHPPLLEEAGLSLAIQWYLDGLTKRSGIETYLDVQPSQFSRLSRDVEIMIFRMIQEALTNVFRHSEAKNAWITVTLDESRLVIKVRDDGRGVPEEIAMFRPGSMGVGVSGMRQRIKEFGGELLLSNLHPGTLVEAAVPITPALRVGAPGTVASCND